MSSLALVALLLATASSTAPPPPAIETAAAIDCTPWGCRCDGYADYFGAIAGQCGGCAGGAGSWWGEHRCNTIAMSGACCDGPACKLAGAAGCQKSVRPPVATDVPSYPPTYNMSRSTIAMPCDYKGYVSELPGWAATTRKFNVLDIDWSNNKAVWANTPGADGKGMSCEEDLVRQATKIKQDDPAHHTWVYRNIVNAYPWMTCIRLIMDDPAYDVWFLRFKNGADGKGPLEHASDGTYDNPVCDLAFTPPKCSPLFHSQTQTPQYAPNGTTKKCGTGPSAKRCTWQPDFGDGMCAKPCDCGRVPCGFYLFDHRQKDTKVCSAWGGCHTLQEWLVSNLTVTETTLLHPDITGLFLDDTWSGSGAGDLNNKNMENDTDLAHSDLMDIASNWTQNFDTVKAAVLKHGGFSWQQLVGNSTCQGAVIHNDIKRNSSGGVTQNDSGLCASQLRTACLADSPYQKGALMYGLSGYFTPEDMPQALVNFLLIRGPYAWLGYSWRPCTTGGQNISWFARNQSLLFEHDYGTPSGLCKETRAPAFRGGTYHPGSGVFVRQWSNATVTMDCNEWEGTIAPKR